MPEPRTRYDFNLPLPPVPGRDGRRVTFEGVNASRDITAAAIQVFVNEVLARQRERRQSERPDQQEQ